MKEAIVWPYVIWCVTENLWKLLKEKAISIMFYTILDKLVILVFYTTFLYATWNFTYRSKTR